MAVLRVVSPRQRWRRAARTGRWAAVGAHSVAGAAIAWVVASFLLACPADAATLVGTGTGTDSKATSLVLNMPAGVQSGDVLLAEVDARAGTEVTITKPSGWTLVRQENGNSTILAQAIYYRVAGSSEPTSYTWTFSPAESGAGGIAAYRGVNNSTPVDTSSGKASTSNGSAIEAPSITTSAANEVVVGFFGTSKKQSVPAPGGMTQRWDVTPETELEVGASDMTQATAGATGSKTANVSGNAAWVGQLVALHNVCVGGPLNLTAPGSVSFGSTGLTGADQLISTTAILTPEDETGSGAGWNITGTSTPFTNGTHSLPTTATRITAASVAPATGNCSLPTNGVTYPVTLPAAATPPTPIKLYNAAASTGKGPANVTLTAQVSVPASTYTGTYSSTWTLTIASGP